jgi:cardiolipin synthase
MLNIPNTLTILRVLLVPIFVISLLNRHFGWSLVIFVVAGITDAIDGVIARIAHQKTTLGEYLDPIADKLLLTSAFVALAILKTIPSWLAVIVLTRDVIISLGFIILFLMDRKPEIRPTTFSKANTVAAGTTILTGLQYIYLGTRMTDGTGKNARG